MTYFAGENFVSTDPFDGAVPISEEQYQRAIAAICSGQIVTVAGGFAIIDPPAPETEPPAPPETPEAMLSKAQFLVRLTQVPTPPIFSADEAMAAMESFPPAFVAALADKPLQYRLNAVGLWKNISFVPRNHPLFLDILAYYAAQNGLSEAQAVALGDLIFEGAP